MEYYLSLIHIYLVKNICDVNDQNIYTRKVFVHFNRFYLRLANEYGMKSEVKVYYNKLKVVGENGIKQKIYYIMGMLGIKAVSYTHLLLLRLQSVSARLSGMRTARTPLWLSLIHIYQ